MIANMEADKTICEVARENIDLSEKELDKLFDVRKRTKI